MRHSEQIEIPSLEQPMQREGKIISVRLNTAGVSLGKISGRIEIKLAEDNLSVVVVLVVRKFVIQRLSAR